MRIVCLLISLLLMNISYAECIVPLNKISLPLLAEKWITTQTALVSVMVHAAVANKGIEKVQGEVMGKLSQLSNKGEWHVISFDRQLDKSGLENLQLVAEVRLPQTELALLRDKAKQLSQPGETFTIDSVQFIPSEDEIRQANTDLRANIYQQAKKEIEILNKMYTDQTYYLNQIDFTPQVMPMAANTMYMAKTTTNNAARSSLSIGNKQVLQATVTLASMPPNQVQKITHPTGL
jgi:hypothetical protein